MISFQLVAQKQQHPPANKKCAAPDPSHEQERHEARENQRYANSMQNFVPPGRVFVIVLRHVVRQTEHNAPPRAEKLNAGFQGLYSQTLS